jgi:hypothetical protein
VHSGKYSNRTSVSASDSNLEWYTCTEAKKPSIFFFNCFLIRGLDAEKWATKVFTCLRFSQGQKVGLYNQAGTVREKFSIKEDHLSLALHSASECGRSNTFSRAQEENRSLRALAGQTVRRHCLMMHILTYFVIHKSAPLFFMSPMSCTCKFLKTHKIFMGRCA